MKLHGRTEKWIFLLAILVLLGIALNEKIVPFLSAEESVEGNTEEQESTEELISEDGNQEVDGITFDVQPATVEEIEEIISAYKENVENEAVRPHWEFELDATIMPSGYICTEITEDDEFGAAYYTFEEEDNIYDTQPTSLTEVQKLISDYQEEYLEKLAQYGFLEAIKVRKPHWKYHVKDAFMPNGYTCDAVTEDEEFAGTYYTFFLGAGAAASVGSWSGTGIEADPYQISSPEQLKELSDEVAGGNTFAGEYFIVTANLDMSGYNNWVPIGSSSQLLSLDYHSGASHPLLSSIANAKYFSGNLDGQDHTISNLSCTGRGTGVGKDYLGVFGITVDATIKNLTISNSNISGRSGMGALVGYSSGDTIIENCHVKNSNISTSVTGTGLEVAGLIGEINFEENDVVRVLDCSAEETNLTNNLNEGITGGLIGHIRARNSGAYTSANPNWNGDVLVKGCSVSGGSITARYYSAGGVVARVSTYAVGGNTIEISDCTSDIPINVTTTTGYNVGGVIGLVWLNEATTNTDFLIENCHAYGSVTSTSYYVGGLAGYLEITNYTYTYGNSLVIEGSSAHGNVNGGSYFNGGLVGHMHCGVNINNSWATGNVTGTLHGNGGLVGDAYSGVLTRGQNSITNCYATGHVKGGNYTGGLVGWSRDCNINNSYATGSVSGTSTSSGGLIGYFYTEPTYFTTTIKNCYATGTVLSGSGGFAGGFGTSNSNTTFIDCFYDTTTTKKTTSGVGTKTGVTALTTGYDLNSTNGMINIGSYPTSWGVQNNVNGAAGGTGKAENPWYIDDKITYPYLWYQYDGHSKEEVNYNLGTAKYSFADNSITDKHIAPRRADFLLSDAGTNQATYYNVKTAGAQEVYFPYLAQDFGFDGNSEIRVPSGTATHTIANSTTPYSMGGISATDIISFDPLPYAEKTSDRETWQDGVTSTYTIRGDLVEYTVTITNPSIRYEWLNVTLNDPLPEGVTLVEGLYNSKNYDITVKVNNDSEVVVPKDTADSGSSYYYTYSKATSDSETDSPLVVYLGDFETATELAGGGIEMYVVEVTFTAIIDRRAVSQFPLPDNETINGDNIRNTGTVNGTLREKTEPTNFFDYETDFDDKNTDPVYDSYKVSYIGNGGKTDYGDLKYDEYYLYDKTFTVNDNLGTPFQFNRIYYLFLGEWYSRAEVVERATETYTIGSTLGLVANANPIASGYRDAADEVDNVYDDYYALTDFKLYAPWKEQTGSITIKKVDEDGTALEGARFLLEKLDENGDLIPLKWDDTAGKWITMPQGETYTGETNSSGNLILGKDAADDNTLSFGTYRLTEVQSPNGYSLMKEALIIILPYEKVLATDPADGWDITYVNDEGNRVYSYFDLTYTITNVGAFKLPEAGNIGIPWYLYAGALLIFTAVMSVIVRQRQIRRRKANFQKQLLAIEELMKQRF